MRATMTTCAQKALPSPERFLAAAVVQQALEDLAPRVDDAGRPLPDTRRRRVAIADIEAGGLEYWLDLLELGPGALALVRERIDLAVEGV